MGRLIEKTTCNPELFGPEVRRVYSEAANRPGARTAMVNYYRALMRRRDTLDMGDFRVEVPTLMVWGEEDVALHINMTKGTGDWVSDFTLKRFPACHTGCSKMHLKRSMRSFKSGFHGSD